MENKPAKQESQFVIIPGFVLVHNLTDHSFLIRRDTDGKSLIIYKLPCNKNMLDSLAQVIKDIQTIRDNRFVLHNEVIQTPNTENDRKLFVGYPWCAGGSLAQMLKDGLRPDPIVIFVQLVACVGTMHLYNSVCRYLAPSAVLFPSSSSPELRIDSCRADLLKPKIVDCYLAPELMMEGKLAPTTSMADMWSLGAILYTLLTGKPPYSSTADQLFFATVNRPDFSPIKDEDLKKLLAHLLMHDPNYRLSLYGLLHDPVLKKARNHPCSNKPHMLAAFAQLDIVKMSLREEHVVYEPKNYLYLVEKPKLVFDPAVEFDRRVRVDIYAFIEKVRELLARTREQNRSRPALDTLKVLLECTWMIICSYTSEWLNKIDRQLSASENIFNLTDFRQVKTSEQYKFARTMIADLCAQFRADAQTAVNFLMGTWEAIVRTELNSNSNKALIEQVNEALNCCGKTTKMVTKNPREPPSRQLIGRYLAYVCKHTNVRDEAQVALVVDIDHAIIQRGKNQMVQSTPLRAFAEVSGYK